jgi:hypothetical protein
MFYMQLRIKHDIDDTKKKKENRALNSAPWAQQCGMTS